MDKKFKSWIDAGFENYLNTPNQIVYRFLSRLALKICFTRGILGYLDKKTFSKFAYKYKIPLVIYGDSPSEYGSPVNEYISDYDINWHTCEKEDDVYISGESLKTLRKFGLKDYDLYPFVPMLRKIIVGLVLNV